VVAGLGRWAIVNILGSSIVSRCYIKVPISIIPVRWNIFGVGNIFVTTGVVSVCRGIVTGVSTVIVVCDITCVGTRAMCITGISIERRIITDVSIVVVVFDITCMGARAIAIASVSITIVDVSLIRRQPGLHFYLESFFI
jgi:hypothetical protein